MKRIISVFVSLLLILSSTIAVSATTFEIVPTDPILIVTIPSAPSNLVPDYNVAGYVNLTWTDNSSNELSFTIQRKTGSGAYTDLTTTATGTSFSDFYIQSATTYTYRIKAVGTMGSSAWSNETTPVTILESTPNAPSDLQLETYVSGYVFLSWKDNSDVEETYTIQRKTAGGTFSDFLTGQTNTEVTDYYTEDGTSYTYRVKAKNSLGDSPWSNEATVVTYSSTVVNAPSLLVVGVTNNIASLSWKDNSTNELGFTVERKEVGGTFAYLNGTGESMTSLVDNSLVSGKSYVYRVKAINKNLTDSDYSNEVTVSAAAIETVSAPSKLTAGVSGKLATLSWKDNSTNEQGFTVERKVSGGTYTSLSVTGANTTSLIDNSLVAEKVYIYRVKAINSTLGDSLYSNEATISTVTDAVDYSTASTWAIPEIEKAIGYKLTTDHVLTSFTQKITREEFCEIAVKLYVAISGKSVTATSPNPFTDTTNSEILKAYKLGIVKGITDTTFVPSSSITRQEICVMLLRTLKAADPGADYGITGAPVIADEKTIAPWALESVKYMNKAGIMNGTGGNKISPLGNTTKEQAIALITRMYEDFN